MLYPNPETRNEKSYWPHAIAGLLFAFACVQFTLVRIATTGFEGPDQVQYYKMGLEFSKEVQRQKAQRELGWSLTQEVSGREIHVQLRDRQGRPLQGRLTVCFKRPATKTQDFEAAARPVADGYVLPFPGEGRWICAYRFECGGQTWLGERRL